MQNILGLPTGQTWEPNQRFNLFHIDSNEVHLDSVKVQIFNPNLKILEPGLLHVCSRSVVFDSNQMETNLLKLKYQGLNFDSFSGDHLQSAGGVFGQIFELLHQQIPSQVLQQYIQEICVLVIAVVGRNQACYSIPRVKPGPAASQQGGSFIFIVNEEVQRQSHLIYTLSQFCSHDSDEKIQIKRLREMQKKRYYEFIQSEPSDIKQTVTTITIEGEHTCVMVSRQDRLDLFPILNAPYQPPQTTIMYDQIQIVRPYIYLQRSQALRIVTKNCQEYLIECKSKKNFERIIKFLQSQIGQQQEIGQVQQLWQDGLITNCEYLIAVNFYANRSFNDATQYPIFPWVIANYKQDPNVRRDFNLAAGCLSKEKVDQFKSRYYEVISKQPDKSPYMDECQLDQAFQIPSYVSTPGIVLYYLIRKYPSFLCRIQQQALGCPPDQIFYSIAVTFANQQRSQIDNKELIPEFYIGDGSFLMNIFDADLGTNHMGSKIQDVELAQWAKSKQNFILMMRQALDNSKIENWIDLIFGYKQQGAQAQACINLYQQSVYSQNQDYMSSLQQEAHNERIRWFGQAPEQIFLQPHCSKNLPKPSQEVEILQKTVTELQNQIERNTRERIEEYKNLEKFYSKKLQKTKEEGKAQIEQLKQRVQQIKQVKSDGDNSKTNSEVQQVIVRPEEPVLAKTESTQSWNDQTSRLKMLKQKQQKLF